ncbi:MAG: thiolase family protein [Ottowia sp.]|uniref:thiolase family protein n=1 Tax=Ottowia sp. TaxID=1898956 RepID=UPI0039E46FC9
MSVYVVGLGLHPASTAEHGLRLEEMVWRTARAALDDAGATRRQIDSVTLGACDELDGRPISSMLMAAPAGGYGTDEIKVTDSGASALALAYARFLSGESNFGLVASWCKTSKTDVATVMRLRGDPFYTRPLGIDDAVADALFAQAVASEYGVDEEEVSRRVAAAFQRAARNPRGMRHAAPSEEALSQSQYVALPLRSGQRAPYSDGAVALALASEQFLRANPECKPLARIAGIGWATDEYRLDGQRLRGLKSARMAWSSALHQAGLKDASALDCIELETPTGWHEAAYVRAFGIEQAEKVSPSGGSFSQNPLFCTGLVNAAEAVLQAAGRAGKVQRPGARWTAAHGCHGYAQQGNVAMVFESAGAVQ